MQKIKTILKQNLPLKISLFGYFIIILQLYYIYQVFVTDEVGGFSFSISTALLILFSMFSVFLFFQLLSTIFSFNKKAVVFANFLGLVIYNLLVAYHFGSSELLNWSVLVDTWAGAFSIEAFNVIYHSFNRNALVYLPCFIGFFTVLELWKKCVSKGRQEKPYLRKIIVTMVLYISIILLPLDTYDPMVYFFKSIHHHYHYSDFFLKNVDLKEREYPLLNDGLKFDHYKKKYKAKPHIFLIIVESLNSSALLKKGDRGAPYTPFLNKLRYNSVYIERFYGNSVVTPKGHFAILFSTIPSIKNKTFTGYKDLRIESIASVLNKKGYKSILFMAHDDKAFDNTGPFLFKRGFNTFEVVEPYLTEEDRKNKLTWGVEDAVFYKRFFEYFDDKRSYNTKDQSYFVTLPTISNHFPFDSVPKAKQKIFNPVKASNFIDKFRKNYANSVRLVDDGIKVFFEELDKRNLAEKSIVIITSDHSFPMGEHGNFHLEAGYHEESYRIPFFLVWKDQLKPRIIKKPHSQVDIAPTIIDLLDLDIGRNNFQGISIFQEKRNKPIYLIQPYGKHLSIIDYPFKYRFYSKTRKEYIYNLGIDPMEHKSIISSIGEDKISYFRKHLKNIFINHYAIENNQIWP